MAADPLNEHLVLGEEPPAESTPAAVPRQVHHRHHHQVQQQPEQCYQPGTHARRGRDGDGSHSMSLAQITVNPAAPSGHHGGFDQRLRTSYHPAPPASSGLRFNVVQQHHGKHSTSELVPVAEDEKGPTAADHSNGVNNNNNGRQARSAPGYGYGDQHRGGTGAGVPHSVGRKQGADNIAGSMATIKSVDIGECGKKWVSVSPL